MDYVGRLCKVLSRIMFIVKSIDLNQYLACNQNVLNAHWFWHSNFQRAKLFDTPDHAMRAFTCAKPAPNCILQEIIITDYVNLI